jgi:AcrR family transcriptional regulator
MPEPTQDRLLVAAKELFARNGYERTSTAAIARRAGTSESQLVRHFGGKRGLLNAIFDRAWSGLNAEIDKRRGKATDPLSAIQAVLTAVIAALHRDEDLAYLLLFEGRRVREAGLKIELSEGFQQFLTMLHGLIRSAQQAGMLNSRVSTVALASALMGAAEGLIRDRLLAKMAGQPQPFSRAQVVTVFTQLLQSMTPARRGE